MQRIQHAAAVKPGMQVVLGGPHLEVKLHRAAQADRDRRRFGIRHQRVENDRRVCAAPVRAKPCCDGTASHFLLALDEHSDVDRQLSGGGHRARHVQQREEVALVIACATRVDAAVADRRLKRW